jgi:hypothetical protein
MQIVRERSSALLGRALRTHWKSERSPSPTMASLRISSVWLCVTSCREDERGGPGTGRCFETVTGCDRMVTWLPHPLAADVV